MATHRLGLTIDKTIEVQNADVTISVERNGGLLGTLSISKGTIDWRRKHAKTGKSSEANLHWSEFATLMEATADKKVKAALLKLARVGLPPK